MANSCKDLPDECWELIFNQLHIIHHSHLESVSLSCKRFLSITNTIRTRLRLRLHPAMAFPISTLFNRFPNIDSIYLRWFNSFDLFPVITDIATSNLNLKTLDFTNIDGLPLESWRILGSHLKNLRVLICRNIRTLRDIELVAIADSMPGLEELDISNPTNYVPDEFQAPSLGEVGVTDSGIEVLSSKLKGLRKINISSNKYLTDKSLMALSTNCIYLSEIDVLNCSLVTEYGIEFVMRNSCNMSSLLVDNIDLGRFDDYSIRCARNISNLVIDDSVVPDEYLHLLVKAGMPLKGFSFSHCMRSCFTFAGISSLLNKYRSLEWLSLDRINFLTDEKMNGLSQCLSALVTIRLSLCFNLTESTFFMLAKNCPLLQNIFMVVTNLGGGRDSATDVKNTRIKSLSLGSNPNLSDECLAKLASVCPSVEVLDVSSCKGITEKGIAEFWKSGSKIRKLRIDGCLGIRNVGNSFELSELEALRAARSGINDDGLVVIGSRCGRLLKLNLEACLGVTTVGLKEILRNCKRLRKIDLTSCHNISSDLNHLIEWMVISRPSPRKIILPYSSLPSESQRKLFLRHGCLILSD